MNGSYDRLSDDERKALASLTPAQRQALDALSMRQRCVRKRSAREFLGLPLYDIAAGGDPLRGEKRGHAKGIVAIGDIATGVFAFGGWARGVFAVGGVATGLFSFGGLSIGVLGAVGGLAISALVAFGGGALGTVAVGGGAIGHYAIGGAAVGNHTAGPLGTDPEALALMREFGITLPASRAAGEPKR